jgi:hypothetical protein
MVEYPFEFRLIEVKSEAISVTTYGLNNQKFKCESLIKEPTFSRGVLIKGLGNAWVAGTQSDRSFSILRNNKR